MGVCGTGHWAELVHAPALASVHGVELVGIHGRTPQRVGELASRFGTSAFDRFDDLLSEVDAVSFVVPPEVQAKLALRAARAGKHLILEKPVATSLEDADRLVEAVANRGLASVTFLTRLFADGVNAFIAAAKAERPAYGESSFASAALLPGSPYAQSQWRLASDGTLWDVGPHVLSVLVPVLGPVTRISAQRVRWGKFTCEMEHEGKARSAMTLDLMDESVTGMTEHYAFAGSKASVEGGPFTYDRQHCFRAAVASLLDRIDGLGVSAPDVRFGRDLVAVLEAATASAAAGGAMIDVPG
jgi:predicted dehydrogenase